MTLKAAPRRALPGHCREIGCDMVVVTDPPPALILHVHAGRVEIYRPSERPLDVGQDFWADVKEWASGLHG